jgi:hypothetical protein
MHGLWTRALKWMALKRKDGGRDEYAIGRVTHTVCKVGNEYETWRLDKPPVHLGMSPTSVAAQKVAEKDMQS